MTLLALVISADDSASQVLSRVLPECGIAVERFSDPAAAIDRLRQQRFEALVIDFDDAQAAAEIYAEGRRLNSGGAPVTVALVADVARTRDILSAGAHFVLYKPLSEENAKAGLRALTALLNRERRRAQRVSVQVPVEITLPDTHKAEGILLDLSETGMDVLTAEAQIPGALLKFHFQLPDGSLDVDTHGQVAWAKPNGQTGVRFLDLDAEVKTRLQVWLHAAASAAHAGDEETVPHCKLTDLSLGGCYVETDSPFPENALIDLCLRADQLAVHTDGMVRVTHPGYGMGVEFPSRTAEQRAQVSNLIDFLRSCPESMLEMSVSPRSLTADPKEFVRDPQNSIAESVQNDNLEADHDNSQTDDQTMDDPLLDLLRLGTTIKREEFLEELRRQRSGETITT